MELHFVFGINTQKTINDHDDVMKFKKLGLLLE